MVAAPLTAPRVDAGLETPQDKDWFVLHPRGVRQRVAQWEGGEDESMRSAAAEIAGRASSGPPEDVPSIGFTLLTHPDGSLVVAIGLLATEADMQQRHEVLESSRPPGDGLGRCASVGFYEVAVDTRM